MPVRSRERCRFTLSCWTCILLAALSGCRGESTPAPTAVDGESPPASAFDRSVFETRGESEPPPDPRPVFAEVAEESGVRFTFFNDAVPGRYFLPEIMGGGVAWLDFDRDGWLDLYVMNGCRLDANSGPDPGPHVNRLYRNLDGRRFVELDAGTAHPGYGQGCVAGDYDADGFADLYVCNYGPNVLLHNNGDGTYEDVTDVAGVGDQLWGSSCVWADLDDDGDLDLYVVNYLDVTLANLKRCRFNGKPGYCGPGEYEPLPDRAYLNQGDGTFVEAAEALGLTAPGGKGLAVAVADFDDDRRPEIYVANDMRPNFLFTRTRAAAAESGSTESAERAPVPRYENVALAAGCAVSDIGHNEASMGVACGDFDGDGRLDIFLTHFYSHKNTLYRNLGKLVFQDDSRRSRIAATSFETLGFGTVTFDYDRDGALDLFVTNGHVLGPEHSPFEMRPQMLRNEGAGRFRDITDFAGPYFQDRWLGRGAAGADYDNDGDLDLVVTHLNRPLALLRNETPTGRQFIGFALDSASRLPPLGGRVIVTARGRRAVLPIVAGGSYLCCSDTRLLCGLDVEAGPVRAEVHWPSGQVDLFESLTPGLYWRIREGSPTEAEPLAGEPMNE